ncbi:MAG: hypothetical protein PHT48_13695 [Dechloromonas sp.]|nr:hypothetical protein [Dechloromonas sp.]
MSLFSVLADLLKPAPQPDPEVSAALDRVIGMVDPLVRAVPRLEKQLIQAVTHALGYCEGLVTALPGPIDINRQAFGKDPLVHALFATPGDIHDMLGRSQPVRDFLARPECLRSDYFYAMLAARRQQKTQYGLAQQGNVIRAEVAQEVLYFSAQTLIEPCCDQEGTRQRLRAKALQSLLVAFNAHVDKLRRKRADLRADASLEQALLAHHQSPETESDAVHSRHLAELDFLLQQNADALMPEHLAKTLADFLNRPETALSLTPVTLSVDRMGILYSADQLANRDLQTLSFPELSSRDRRLHMATLVRIARAEAEQAVAEVRDRQHRFILI